MSGEVKSALLWNDNPHTYVGQHMRLMFDGHLKVYRFELWAWEVVSDLTDSSKGDYYMPLDIFFLRPTDFNVNQYNHSTHLKVQILPSETSISGGTSSKVVPQGRKNKYMIGSITCNILLLVAIVRVTINIIRKRRNNGEVDEDYLNNVPGNPCRISYEELKLATENFNKRLGQARFGSVFEEILKDGIKVVVKCLDGIGQVKKLFLAEFESIGRIHHVTLIGLVGFTAGKSFLIGNVGGSLFTWIIFCLQSS
ncbi:hypothetical protein LIER_07225 [Lithospermum erythrorhizon]|uniref:Uncharacterized protein n=1 Tax=Lithospermum erythrorhizon TaxID=34254 RepID=A0AAV3P798_LITER